MDFVDDLAELANLIKEGEYGEVFSKINSQIKTNHHSELEYIITNIQKLEQQSETKKSLILILQEQKLSHEKRNDIQILIKENEKKIGNALKSIGLIYSSIGELDKALVYLEKSLSIFDSIDIKYDEADVLTNIGLIYRELKEFLKSITFLEKAKTIFEDLKIETGIARIIFAIIIIHLFQRESTLLIKYVNELDDFSNEVGNTDMMILNKLAKALYMKTNRKEVNQIIAKGFLYEVSIDKEIEYRIITIASINLIELLLKNIKPMNETETFAEVFQIIDELIEIAEVNNSKTLLIDVYILKSKIYLLNFDFPNSAIFIQEAMYVAIDDGLHILLEKIKQVKSYIDNNLDKWTKLIENNPAIQDRLQIAGIHEFVNEMNIRSHNY